MGMGDLTLRMALIVAVGVFLASFTDAIAGGGGIISVPTYLLAGLPAHYALGTNKLSADSHISMPDRLLSRATDGLNPSKYRKLRPYVYKLASIRILQQTPTPSHPSYRDLSRCLFRGGKLTFYVIIYIPLLFNKT